MATNGTETAGRGDVDFDVIVAGAGVAGCVTAYRLAQAGHEVLLVERGAEPGSKNLSGGVLYCRVMEQIWPDFVGEAPVERVITRNSVCLLNATSFVGLDYRDERLADPINAVTVLRAKLDAWLAAQCERAGVTVMPGVRIDSLVRDGEAVVGVRSDEDELRSHVVVAADGVNSFLCRGAGIREQDPANHLALGVKSVIGLPRDVIEERFHLTGSEGAAYAVVGDCTDGVAGGGFMYTNLDSISIGVVLRLDDLERRHESSSELHDRFLAHPAIAPFLKDGELLEYGSHLVPEGGQAMVRDLTRPGLVVVGDAAGLSLNTGFTVRGMDLAAGSGIAAAKGIDAALRSRDFSQQAMDAYPDELRRTFTGRDLATHARAPAFFENPRLYRDYGRLLADMLHDVYDLDTTPRKRLVPTAVASLRRSPIRLTELARDALAAARAL